MTASLLTTPLELLEHIVLLATGGTTRGPPSVLQALRLSCRTMHQALSVERNPHLYLMLYLDKFDISSPYRHLPSERLSAPHLEQELKNRYAALQCIRRKEFHHPHLAGALATIYAMSLEDDGRNNEQIIWADLPQFVQEFLHKHLSNGVTVNYGWPLENEVNTLAVILFWFITSDSRLHEETTQLRQEFMDILSHYAYAGFRYPCFTEPEYMFYPCHEAMSSVSLHGTYPPARPNMITMQYFGQETTLTLPPVAPFAILSQFVRAEQRPLAAPPELPANRQEALMRGIMRGPTREDIEHFNTKCKTRLVGASRGNCADPSPKSQSHDSDWYRCLLGAYRMPPCTTMGFYAPGILSGRWQGSSITPFPDVYKSILSSSDAPSVFPASGRFPLYVRFHEYYCYTPSLPVPVMDDTDAFFNAFLPRGCRWYKTEDGIEIVGEDQSFKTYYTELQPNNESEQAGTVTRDLDYSNVRDVIVVGETEEPYATAWNGYKYIGRIRPSDGLVVLLREPVSHHALTKTLFLMGCIDEPDASARWRSISNGEQPAEWESIFSMSKVVTTA
ncbi:hypothetical protein V8B97DRAFT_2025765 [Scleroderma yunnanense]